MLLAAAEWVRGHVFTGFPWNLSGYGWGASLAVLQSASLVGIYGLSLFTLALGASLAELADRRWRLPAVLVLLFAVLWGFGAWRLAATRFRMFRVYRCGWYNPIFRSGRNISAACCRGTGNG